MPFKAKVIAQTCSSSLNLFERGLHFAAYNLCYVFIPLLRERIFSLKKKKYDNACWATLGFDGILMFYMTQYVAT